MLKSPLCQDHGSSGIRKHEGKSILWILGIEWYVGATGLDDAEQCGHHLDTSFHVDAHKGVCSHPEFVQTSGNSVGAPIEFRVGNLDALEDDCRKIWCLSDLLFKEYR